MWRSDRRAPLARFLLWLFLLSAFSTLVSLWLEPHSVAFVRDGQFSLGYAVYAAVGIFICTPSPMIACYIALWRSGTLRGPRDSAGASCAANGRCARRSRPADSALRRCWPESCAERPPARRGICCLRRCR